jgi:hypothetical protein
LAVWVVAVVALVVHVHENHRRDADGCGEHTKVVHEGVCDHPHVSMSAWQLRVSSAALPSFTTAVTMMMTRLAGRS